MTPETATAALLEDWIVANIIRELAEKPESHPAFILHTRVVAAGEREGNEAKIAAGKSGLGIFLGGRAYRANLLAAHFAAVAFLAA